MNSDEIIFKKSLYFLYFSLSLIIIIFDCLFLFKEQCKQINVMRISKVQSLSCDAKILRYIQQESGLCTPATYPLWNGLDQSREKILFHQSRISHHCKLWRKNIKEAKTYLFGRYSAAEWKWRIQEDYERMTDKHAPLETGFSFFASIDWFW